MRVVKWYAIDGDIVWAPAVWEPLSISYSCGRLGIHALVNVVDCNTCFKNIKFLTDDAYVAYHLDDNMYDYRYIGKIEECNLPVCYVFEEIEKNASD